MKESENVGLVDISCLVFAFGIIIAPTSSIDSTKQTNSVRTIPFCYIFVVLNLPNYFINRTIHLSNLKVEEKSCLLLLQLFGFLSMIAF